MGPERRVECTGETVDVNQTLTLMAAAVLLGSAVLTGCGEGDQEQAGTDATELGIGDDEMQRDPTSEQLEQALHCVEGKVGYELPRPASPEVAPEMSEDETAAHFDCVFELHLEKVFISPAGLESLELADRIAIRNQRERTCMSDLGWDLVDNDDPAVPVAIAERPNGSDVEERLREDLGTCDVPADVIADGFGS